MKFLTVFLCCLFVVKFAQSDDKSCKNEVKKVIDCMQKKNEDHKAEGEKKFEDLKGKVDKCFTDADCSAPDYSGNSGKGGMMEKMKKTFDDQPEDVKECIKEEFKKVMIKKLNECLAKKHVAKIDEKDLDGDMFEEMHGGHGHDGHDDDNDKDDDKKKMMKSIAAVGTALRKCSEDKGDNARDKVASCIKPLKDQIKAEMCKRKDECKKTVNVTPACEKRFNEVKQAACECKNEKLEEAKKKVEELQAKHRDIEMDEAKEIAGGSEGMKDMNMDTIENCYKKNNKQPPMLLGLLKQAQSGGGKEGGLFGGLFKPKITQKQLQQIHDHIEDQLQNKDCKMCN